MFGKLYLDRIVVRKIKLMLIKNIVYFGFIDKKNKGNVDNGMKKCWNNCIYVNLFDMFYLNIKILIRSYIYVFCI